MVTSAALSTIPPFLQGMLALMDHRREAGEWEFEAPALTSDRDFFFPTPWELSLLRHFRTAFPWAAFHTVEIGLEEQDNIVWTQEDGPFDDVLARLERAGGYCGGSEATLDLTVDWVALDGASGQAVLPEAAKVIISLDQPHPVSGWLTIWPNVFTDEIYIYEGDVRRPMAKTLIPFHPAAQANRARLRRSLQEWERLIGGYIVRWESYRIETGIERYGFAEDARPF